MLRRGGVLLAAIGLAACGPGYKKLKVDKIQSVAVTTGGEQGQAFCAYQPVALRALVTYDDGKQARSPIPGERQRGHLRTSEFAWSSSHGSVDAAAVLSLPDDALAWFDQSIRVTAQVAARPEIAGEATLQPQFDCGGTLDLRGAVGARGGEAEHGGPGETGPVVRIALAYLEHERTGRLVLVRVQRGDDPPEHYLVAPRTPEAWFVIDARGGAGGAGGQGVAGLDGRPGVDGEPGIDGVDCGDGGPGQDGTDGEPGGPGGPAGSGGPGGAGGQVLVSFDARFPELPGHIDVRVDGGEGGAAGPGGAGGRGGRGGAGGAGGKGSTDPADPSCAGVDGPKGVDGAAGPNGPPGPDGVAGPPGPAGEIRRAPVDVRQLFASELERGLPIVTGAAAPEGAATDAP